MRKERNGSSIVTEKLRVLAKRVMAKLPELTFGETLRRERLIRKVSLEEISAATKISMRLLTALERSDLSRLPAPVFTRGFIRAYSKHLGLNTEDMVNAYLADLVGLASGAANAQPTEPKPRPRRLFSRARRSTAGTIVGAVAAILLLLGWIAKPERRTPVAEGPVRDTRPIRLKNVAVSSEPTPVIQESSVLREAQSVAVSLLLEFDEDSWTELIADGRRVFSGLLRRGESRLFEAREGFRLTLGNAGGVRVTVDGRTLDRLGRAGQVVRNLAIPSLRG